MGWVSILVCDGCLERIEPWEPMTWTDAADTEDIWDTALARKWTRAKQRRRLYDPPCPDYKFFCQRCTLALKELPDPTAGRSPARTGPGISEVSGD